MQNIPNYKRLVDLVIENNITFAEAGKILKFEKNQIDNCKNSARNYYYDEYQEAKKINSNLSKNKYKEHKKPLKDDNPKYKQIVDLVILEHISFKEAGKLLNVSDKTVYTSKALAKKNYSQRYLMAEKINDELHMSINEKVIRYIIKENCSVNYAIKKMLLNSDQQKRFITYCNRHSNEKNIIDAMAIDKYIRTLNEDDTLSYIFKHKLNTKHKVMERLTMSEKRFNHISLYAKEKYPKFFKYAFPVN